MYRYRVWLLAAVLSVAVPFLVPPAHAWEFTMDGNFTWEFEIRGQTGKNGFFGLYDVDAGGAGPNAAVAGFFAPFNGWIGQPASSPGFAVVSGTDGSWNTQYMTTNMELRINPAVRVRGLYYIGEWFPEAAGATLADAPYAATDLARGNLVSSQYINNRFPGIQRSFSPGYWNLLWMNAQLPWGEIALGKRPSSFGMGFFWNGAENRSSESCALSADYGPIRIVLSLYPSRKASRADYYNADFDKNNGRFYDLGFPTVTYRDGPLDAGIIFNWGPIRHRGGESQLVAPATRITTRRDQDDDEVYGGAYVKYNNGRFFFNVEGDFDYRTFRWRQANAAGIPVIQPFNSSTYPTTGTRDEYYESYRGAVELGTLCGPSKVALLYAWLSGPDRRYGHQINKTGLAVVNVTEAANVRWASATSSNTGVLRPYSYLMVYAYGFGTHINDDTYHGYAEDASIFAGRLDYAVAANLNAYGSFMWADRVSKSGYGWGFLKPSTALISGSGTGQINKQDRWGAPSIPDTNLGWEVDAGVDWKLLEGLLLNVTAGYWQPGKWWSYACVDKAVPGWDNAGTGPTAPSTAATWGINPSRKIDPIWGLELKVSGQF